MTDMQEKEMIEQAKAGDPKANYELSQWARRMSVLEPDEPRWNSLAAKCLVDAARGGYEPAQRLVAELTSEDEDETPADAPFADDDDVRRYTPASEKPVSQEKRAAPSRDFYDQADEDDYYDDYDDDYAPEDNDGCDDYGDYDDYDATPEKAGFAGTLKKVGGAVKKGGMAAAASVGGLVSKLGGKRTGKAGRSRTETSEPEEERRGSSRTAARSTAARSTAARGTGARNTSRRGGSAGGFSAWVEENWKVVRIVCVVICVVLVALIVILLVPSKDKTPEATPTANPTAEPTPVPTQEPFPNEATKLEISTTSTLLYRPGDSDASAYLPASQTLTVIEPDAENLRQGPSGSDYPDVIMRVPEGSQVTAYARYQNAEGTVWYLINYGGTWGWMYGPSLA